MNHPPIPDASHDPGVRIREGGLSINVRIPNPFRLWRCWFKHDWEHFQHNVAAAEDWHTDRQRQFVIAFKVCRRCANSKLIHLLE